MNILETIETCKCGCFVFDAEAKKCVKCGTERIDPVAIPNGGVDKEESFQTILTDEEESRLALKSAGHINMNEGFFNANIQFKPITKESYDGK